MHYPATSPAPNTVILAAWHTQVAAVTRDPWLATAVLDRSDEVVPRFAYFYHQLSTLPRRIRRALYRKGSLTVAGLALMLALGNTPVDAATIPVDGGACTLARAIAAANSDTATGGCPAGSGADVIDLVPGSTHTIMAVNNSTYGDTGLPVINSTITIEGHGATIRRNPAAPNFHLLAVSPTGNLTLNETTVTGGDNGLRNACGNVTISHSTISGNTDGVVHIAPSGDYDDSCPSSPSATVIIESTISGNSGAGVLSSSHSMTIETSTIAGNGNSGVWIRSPDGSVNATIRQSTISGNHTSGNGGGISIDSSPNGFVELALTNSTISGNTAGGDGGGLFTHGDGYTISRTVANTITGNTAGNRGGGIYSTVRYEYEGSLGISDSLISGNTAPIGREVYSGKSVGVSSYGYNLFGFDGDPGLVRVDELRDYDVFPGEGVQLSDILDPVLADNGGPTLTHTLVTGSPAVDVIPGTNPGCTGTDQRGVLRPQGDGCDIGAVELEQDQLTLQSTQDSFIRPQAKSANEGAHPRLDLSRDNRLVVGFDLSSVDPANIARVTLVLTIDDATPPDGMGANGALVDVLRLLAPWDEGNRASAGLPQPEKQRGSGAGVTWACASDGDISNHNRDCDDTWDGGTFASTPSDVVRHTNGMTGEVEFDVTADVQAGANSWLLKQRGQGRIGYYSKDHPDVSTNLSLAPRVVIELQ